MGLGPRAEFQYFRLRYSESEGKDREVAETERGFHFESTANINSQPIQPLIISKNIYILTSVQFRISEKIRL